MKLISSLLVIFFFPFANATIAGPSCDKLTKQQVTLLKSAAIKHAKQSTEAKLTQVKGINIDCHDYDGVFSSAVFEISANFNDEDQNSKCTQEIAVGVTYNSERKILTITRKSDFTIEEASELDCQD